MKLDIEVRAFPVDENLQAALDKCAAEGLAPLAGAPPVMVYWMVRTVVVQAQAGVGTMSIDDSKVQVIRAGEKPKPN